MASDPLARLREKRKSWLESLADGPVTRTCAGCDACCTVLDIPALKKPAYQPCAHLLDQARGCSIWGRHPPACKVYVCLWRAADQILPADMFPADAGFVVTIDNVKTWPLQVNVAPAPGRTDAWDTPRFRRIFAAMAIGWNCAVAVVGPDARATYVFTPRGRLFSKALSPQMFPGDGASLALASDEYGPDRRPPFELMAEARLGFGDAET